MNIASVPSAGVALAAAYPVAYVAYALNRRIVLSALPPAWPLAHWVRTWSAQGRLNGWGEVPEVVELSQWLPDAAGPTAVLTVPQELLRLESRLRPSLSPCPCGVHVAGDMSAAAAALPFPQLVSNGGQETQDMVAIATAAALVSQGPFIHIYRESPQLPSRPSLEGLLPLLQLAQESRHHATMGALPWAMATLERTSGRRYHLCDYYGSDRADRVVAATGASIPIVRGVVDHLNCRESVGMLAIRSWPLNSHHLISILPRSVRAIGVLDALAQQGVTETLCIKLTTALLDQRFTTADYRFPQIISSGSEPPSATAIYQLFNHLQHCDLAASVAS